MDVSPRPNPIHSGLFRTFTVLVVLTGLAVIASGVWSSVRSVPDSPVTAAEMVAVAPGGLVQQEDVPEAVAVLYRAAHEHADIYAEVPCFCGCEAMLGHRHLLDCFARPNGGWEAHALGCGVCLGEAQQVEDLLAIGIADAGSIRELVIAEWGDPYQ